MSNVLTHVYLVSILRSGGGLLGDFRATTAAQQSGHQIKGDIVLKMSAAVAFSNTIDFIGRHQILNRLESQDTHVSKAKTRITPPR